jgi:hypothetical protein
LSAVATSTTTGEVVATLGIDDDLECWTSNTHQRVFAIVALIMAVCYSLTSFTIGSVFVTDVTHSLDIKLNRVYILQTKIASLLVVTLSVYVGDHAETIGVVLTNLVLAWQLRRAACCVVWFNTASLTVNLAICWAGVVSLCSVWYRRSNDDDVDSEDAVLLPVIIMFVGEICICVGMIYLHVRHQQYIYAPSAKVHALPQ